MEDDGGAPAGWASPPTPKKAKISPEEEPKELLKHEHHSEADSKAIEDDDGDQKPKIPPEEESKELLNDEHHSEEELIAIEDDDGDRQQQSPPPSSPPPSSPPLLDMIDVPLRSPLPPTPPLPSSPRDIEPQESEDEGPPPGWDNNYELQEQQEQLATPAAVSETSSDIKTEDVPRDSQNEEGFQPQSHTYHSPLPNIVFSELIMCENSHNKSEEQDSEEDEGPPPGWESKSQPEPELQTENATTPPSDIKTQDVQKDSPTEEGSKLQSQAPELIPSDKRSEEQDSEDEGPPPGWESNGQPEPELQTESLATPQLDIKTEDVQQDAPNEEISAPKLVSSELPCENSDKKSEELESEEDEGPPPGWESKSQPELQTDLPTTTPLDIKTADIQRDAPSEEVSPPKQVPMDIKVEEHDSEDEGPPPGWESNSQPEPELQTETPINTQLDIKTEDLQQDASNEEGSQPPGLITSDINSEEQDSEEDEGPPPGWDSTCQPGPELQTSRPPTPLLESKIENYEQGEEGPPPGWESTPQQQSPIFSSDARNGYELNNVKVMEESQSPQTPSKLQSIPEISPQTLKPPTSVNNPEMGQMVCGSCRRLLSYPKGARYVECACCLEENYVLEEHEVGQVICGGCNVLLMYPYGAPKVCCANCSTETEIGDQNQRPPLSEHKRRARRNLKRMQVG